MAQYDCVGTGPGKVIYKLVVLVSHPEQGPGRPGPSCFQSQNCGFVTNQKCFSIHSGIKTYNNSIHCFIKKLPEIGIVFRPV